MASALPQRVPALPGQLWNRDGSIIDLVVLAGAHRLDYQRCTEALDLVESKRLDDGGFPAEHRYYRPTQAMVRSQRSLVDWGGVSRRRMNPWVSARAAVVLHAARRLVSPAAATPE